MKWPEGSEPCATDKGLVAGHDWTEWQYAYTTITGERFHARYCKGCKSADLCREDHLERS